MIIFSQGFLPIAVAMILGGLSDSFISGSLEALVYDSHKQDGTESSFPQIQAKNSFWFQIGLASATAVGGFLFLIWYGLPYLAYALASIIAATTALLFIEPKIDTLHFTLHNYFVQIKLGVREAFKSKRTSLISLFYIAVAGITWTNNLYFFDYIMVELGFPDDIRGILMAGIRIFNVTVLMTLLKNNHIFTRKRSYYFFPTMMIVFFLPGIFLQGWWALIFVAGAVMAGTGRWVVLTRYTNEEFDSKYRATAISALSMIIGVLYITITALSGPVIDSYGVRMVYTLLGVLTIFTVLPLAVLVAQDHKMNG